MVSDSYPYITSFEDAALEVKSRLLTKKANEDFGIAGDDEDGQPDDQSVTVVDVVDAHRLKEITLTKKEWTMYIKEYLKKIKEELEKAGKAERIPMFQKGATGLVKHIIQKFDEIQIFVGENYDMEAGMGYCYYKEQTDAGPTFFFFLDGMKEEKY